MTVCLTSYLTREIGNSSQTRSTHVGRPGSSARTPRAGDGSRRASALGVNGAVQLGRFSQNQTDTPHTAQQSRSVVNLQGS